MPLIAQGLLRGSCASCRRSLVVSAVLRALEEPPPLRQKVRSMPLAGEKPPRPPPSLENHTLLHSAPVEPAQTAEDEQWTYVREADVMQRVYSFEPPRNPAIYYVGVIFLFFAGVNLADAWRLDSLGSISRPLLPSQEQEARPVTERRRGAAWILATTTALCALLAYLPTRHVSSLTIVPRFPRPSSDQQRIAWYHHADCIIHSTSDFIALPLASFRKGKRVPFAQLRLGAPLTSRPTPSQSVGGQSATSTRTPPKRAASIYIANETSLLSWRPLTQYYLARPDAQNVKVECSDILVLERALQFNERVEEAERRARDLKQKMGEGR